MVEPIALDQVAGRLGLGDRASVAFIGGGGKTTTMFAIAHSLDGVVATTTTKMQSGHTGGLTTLVDATDDEVVEAVGRDRRVLLWGASGSDKARGIAPGRCDSLAERVRYLLVEADGARRRPFTAPGPLEPVIPSRATHVVACIGADALGRCIGDQCHRPMRVAALAGCGPYERLTPARAARALRSDRGSRKGCPDGASFSVAVTKVDATNIELVDELVRELEPVTAIAVQFVPGTT